MDKRMDGEEFERYAWVGSNSDPSVAHLANEARRARESELRLAHVLGDALDWMRSSPSRDDAAIEDIHERAREALAAARVKHE